VEGKFLPTGKGQKGQALHLRGAHSEERNGALKPDNSGTVPA
jgi:serine/threonine protein phosphatase PrpC